MTELENLKTDLKAYQKRFCAWVSGCDQCPAHINTEVVGTNCMLSIINKRLEKK